MATLPLGQLHFPFKASSTQIVSKERYNEDMVLLMHYYWSEKLAGKIMLSAVAPPSQMGGGSRVCVSAFCNNTVATNVTHVPTAVMIATLNCSEQKA